VPHLHFETLTPNLRVVAIRNVHSGREDALAENPLCLGQAGHTMRGIGGQIGDSNLYA
jgi:hypothetical protein